MRIGKVIGRVTHNVLYSTLHGGRFLILEVQDRFALAGQPRKSVESLVAYDHLGAGEGDLVAFTESREACMPFYPRRSCRSTRTSRRSSTVSSSNSRFKAFTPAKVRT
jgi:microcompartment protein CcmK/EutM